MAGQYFLVPQTQAVWAPSSFLKTSLQGSPFSPARNPMLNNMPTRLRVLKELLACQNPRILGDLRNLQLTLSVHEETGPLGVKYF